MNSKEHENVMSFRRYIITFLGIKEQAYSLGVPDILLKIFRLQRRNLSDTNTGSVGLGKSFIDMILWGFNGELLPYAGRFGPGLLCPGMFHPNLGGGSFQQLKLCHFGQFSE